MTLALRSLAIGLAAVASAARAAPDPLPSWNDGAVKQRLVAFVQAASDPSSPDHVPPAERVAVFDNDGTLWPEQPAYFQLLFAIDRVKALAARHPEWRKRQPFAAALAGDLKALAASGEKGLLELVMATHAGLTPEEFRAVVREWLVLQWTTMAAGIRLGLLVHHTDAEREYAYDRQSHVGRLDLALDEAPGRGWVVVSTKRDWARMFRGE